MSAPADGKDGKTAGDTRESKSGIPAAEFIADVSEYLVKTKQDCDGCLKALHVLHSKYKFIEGRLLQQKKALVQKIPDIKTTLGAIRFLKKRKASDETTFETNYQLSDNVYSKATVDSKADRVFLWLGANVMLEYTYDEAETTLSTSLDSAKTQSDAVTRDLNFLKDQITISEVNIARVHNYRVVLRKKAGKA